MTFLFTDVEGSTPLWDAFPDAMGVALARHDEIVRSAIESHGGYVFSTHGDEFAAAFERAGDAVAAALAAQRELSAEQWRGGVVLRVRMGLHSGEVEERDGDYFGPPVNRAARIMGVANGAQVLVSELTAGLIDRVSGVELLDLGVVELKGVVEPIHIFGVAGNGHEWVDVPLLAGPVGRGNLPRLRTESVGDLAELRRRVANLAQAGVVTLTGSGGVGKTRAAVEIGWLVVDEFVDGVWLVELAPVNDPDLAAAAVANTLGARLQPGATMVESIVEWCLGRRMLLILDNCEHVLDAASEVVRAITTACPTVTIIATSREPLGVSGETVARIPSLIEQHAIELFVLRARSADVGFEPSDTDTEAIAAICHRLDGIPLAIELAAARIRSLTPAELLGRLDDRFRLLRSGSRGSLERHQTLRAAVAWSYQLLAAEAQLLFDRLSVFAGSFDLAAAEAICSGDGLDEVDVVDVLGDLVDKSMVTVHRTDHGMRYRLLETLRQYGEERLDDRGETAQQRDTHLQHFNGVGRVLKQQWFSSDQVEAATRFRDEWDNLAAAHAWAITSGDIEQAHELINSTSNYATSCYCIDHQEWCERTLDASQAADCLDPTTLSYAGMWAFNTGDPARAVRLGRHALELDATSVPGSAAAILGHMLLGEQAEAIEIAQRLRTQLRALHDPIERYIAAFALHAANDRTHIESDIDSLTAAANAIGAPTTVAFALRGSADRWRSLGAARAIADLEEAIRLQKLVGAHPVWETCILSRLMIEAGHPEARTAAGRALSSAYDQRLWAAVELVLESVPSLLARDQPEIAAIVFGHIATSPPSGWGSRATRNQAPELVDAVADAKELMARGAAMDHHDIVTLSLTALVPADTAGTATRTRHGDTAR